MKRTLLFTLAAAAALLPARAEDEFQWLTDLDAARKLAAETGRPMCVVFR